MNTNLKIAYIGGGSRIWARKLMCDLALEPALSGSMALYDIDNDAAEDNEFIGNKINSHPDAVGKWTYEAVNNLKETLIDADFVIISVLPGTFKEMAAEVHLPEKYGIYQSVGDTVGFGGYMRAMRCVPIFREFAAAVREYCPKAFVINYTNPMTLCVRTLYEEFPGIKAFGCCHEVFSTQELFVKALELYEGIKDVQRDEIIIDIGGINHFTWVGQAVYKGKDLFPLFEKLIGDYGESGFGLNGDWENSVESCGNVVKFKMYREFGVIPAAGDRHIAEFLPNKWFLRNPETAIKNKFLLTPVSWRLERQKRQIACTQDFISGKDSIPLVNSGEEGVRQMKALLGLGDFITNINIPNEAETAAYAKGAVVETNAFLCKGRISQIIGKPLPKAVQSLISRHINNQEAFIEAAFEKNTAKVLSVLRNDPQCETLTRSQSQIIFDELIKATYDYLKGYWF